MLAQRIAPARKAALPQAVAQNHHMIGAQLVFLFREGAAEHRLRVSTSKKFEAHARRSQAFGLLRARIVHAASRPRAAMPVKEWFSSR